MTLIIHVVVHRFFSENQFSSLRADLPSPVHREAMEDTTNSPEHPLSPKLTHRIPRHCISMETKHLRLHKSTKELCSEVPIVLNISDGLKYHFKNHPDHFKQQGIKDIFILTSMMSIRIRVEPHRGSDVFQCFNCQGLTHTQHIFNVHARC